MIKLPFSSFQGRGRTPESFLYDPFHPTTMLAVTAVMSAVALLTLALQTLQG